MDPLTTRSPRGPASPTMWIVFSSFLLVLAVLLFTYNDILSVSPTEGGASASFSRLIGSLLLFGTSDSIMANAMAAVDLGWYAPSQTLINNLTHVASSATTGVYGFIFNSSSTPDDQYGTYNWCNMPHVRAQEYVVPSDEYELVYVELVSSSPRQMTQTYSVWIL